MIMSLTLKAVVFCLSGLSVVDQASCRIAKVIFASVTAAKSQNTFKSCVVYVSTVAIPTKISLQLMSVLCDPSTFIEAVHSYNIVL